MLSHWVNDNFLSAIIRVPFIIVIMSPLYSFLIDSQNHQSFVFLSSGVCIILNCLHTFYVLHLEHGSVTSPEK